FFLISPYFYVLYLHLKMRRNVFLNSERICSIQLGTLALCGAKWVPLSCRIASVLSSYCLVATGLMLADYNSVASHFRFI
uniref:Uncharacterized protein n=1 Tax=Coturnix japonica TaxID=93934 RepID=A0A8C2SY99_COTJA